MRTETEAEQRVWNLLTRDFYWQPPPDFAVQMYGGADGRDRSPRLQIFEVALATVFARLRPDYEWHVTPNRADDGLDFVGRHQFLSDEALGIAAAITVGGQCKKRTRVNDVVGEVAGSLARMAAAVNPTFFVVALSARLNEERVTKAQAILEQTHHRHCHILDRRQIEGLLREHLASVDEILRAGLTPEEAQDVLDYFATEPEAPSTAAGVAAPDRVLAGVPFSVTVSFRSSIAAMAASRLWWRPSEAADASSRPVTLIGPIGADGSAGVALAPDVDDLLLMRCTVELVTYAVGDVDLGEVLVGRRLDGTLGSLERIELGQVRSVENVRPRFFERPFRPALARLSQAYERALAGGAASIGVVGAGGSGKSRVCEEFCLDRRRRGCTVVAAKQTATLDDPHRVLADLFVGLLPDGISIGDPADAVIHAIAKYDAALAATAELAIRSIFGRGDSRTGTTTDQSVLSSLLLLIVAWGRRAPLIVHLQDLHWCSADVLLLLEKLVWQLDHVLASRSTTPRSPESGVLFLFEGRVRERGMLADGAWTSEPFEAFLQKLGCPTAPCAAFAPEDSLEFVRRLFEDRHSARRQVSTELLELQGHLVERVHRTAGGNPFHTLEQIQLLKESGVIDQNPETGLLYMVKPLPSRSALPDSVFASIELRWRYLKQRTPELALLVWAAALLEDRLPTPLFRHLWREIAPDVSLHDVDATEMLSTLEGEEREVAFRHENYFQSIRRFEVAAQERERVVGVYAGWFASLRRHHPNDLFRWARALLELPERDAARAQELLRSALRDSQRHGDRRLARRISTTALDVAWSEDDRAPLRVTSFLRRCDDELALVRDLLGSDRAQASRRLTLLQERIEERLSGGRARSARTLQALCRRQLTAEVLRSQHLFNDQRPAKAAETAANAVRGVRASRPGDEAEAGAAWDELEMEALHSHAVGLALSGETAEAIEASGRAVEIARSVASPLSAHVVNTHAAIMLARDPERSERILRGSLAGLPDTPAASPLRDEAEIDLTMALILRAHRLAPAERHEAPAILAEAEAYVTRVFNAAFQLGQYPDAGAAALLLGVISALRGDGDEASWFAQAVAAAARGRQMETLWRAHINLAVALSRSEDRLPGGVRDHARAALEIIEETLSPYSHPERSPRFKVVRVPLAQAVRLLLLTGDEKGDAALERYPTLQPEIDALAAGAVPELRDGVVDYFDWLWIDGARYVLY